MIMKLMNNRKSKIEHGARRRWKYNLVWVSAWILWTDSDGSSIARQVKENCMASINASTVIESTYRPHVDYVRAGVTSELVTQFYNFALRSVSSPTCVCGLNKLAKSCLREHFLDEVASVSLDLWWAIHDSQANNGSNHIFSHVLLISELPSVVTVLEKQEIDRLQNLTSHRFTAHVGKIHREQLTKNETDGIEIALLPADENARIDVGRQEFCNELAKNTPVFGMTLSATALISFVTGLMHQIQLCEGNNTEGIALLQEQVQLVYNAAQCTRRSGVHLQVPVINLDKMLVRAHLAFLNASYVNSMTILGSLPTLTAVARIVHLSKHLFPTLIRGMAGFGLNGQLLSATWTGSNLVIESIPDVLKRTATLKHVCECSQLFKEKQEKEEKSFNNSCKANYRYMTRLNDISDNREMCCSESCLQKWGNIFELVLLNEMCCQACNGLSCNVDMLVHVSQVQEQWAARNTKFAIGDVVNLFS